MAGIEVKTKGTLLTGRWRRAVPTAVRAWLQGVLRRVRDDARRFAPTDTGAFRRSILYRTRQSGMAVEGEVYTTTPPAVANTIEYGRRAGAKMPPSGALVGWMARHGIDPKHEFAVRRGIARRGIPAKRPFAQAFERSRALLNTQARLLESRIVRDLS